MSLRLCGDVGTSAATSWCNSEYCLRILVYMFFVNSLVYGTCLLIFCGSNIMCMTSDRSASMYLLIKLLVCEYSKNVFCPDPEFYLSMH
jgi:hypothetical protein